MKTARLEAFTDGVLAIVITITVLELKVPHEASFGAIRGTLPLLIAYVLAYVNVGLYWNNHHHLFQGADHVDGRVLWANLFTLFWLSLVPWVIRWLDEAGFAAFPTAAYGLVLGMAAVGYHWLQREVIRVDGKESPVAHAVGSDFKGKLSILLYALAMPLAFVSAWIADAIYVGIALWWIVPDRRIERELQDG
jgi:uncharacterized membrane protein